LDGVGPRHPVGVARVLGARHPVVPEAPAPADDGAIRIAAAVGEAAGEIVAARRERSRGRLVRWWRRWWRRRWWWWWRRDGKRAARPARERSGGRRQRVARAGLVDLETRECRHAAHRCDRAPTGQGPPTRVRPDRQRDVPREPCHRVPGGIERSHGDGRCDRRARLSARRLLAEPEVGRGRRWRRWRWWRRWWWWWRWGRDGGRAGRPARGRSG